MNSSASKSKRLGKGKKASNQKGTPKSSPEGFAEEYRSMTLSHAKVYFWFSLIVCSVFLGLQLSFIIYAIAMSQTFSEFEAESKLLLSLSFNTAVAAFTFRQARETRLRLAEMYDRAQANPTEKSLPAYEKCPVCVPHAA